MFKREFEKSLLGIVCFVFFVNGLVGCKEEEEDSKTDSQGDAGNDISSDSGENSDGDGGTEGNSGEEGIPEPIKVNWQKHLVATQEKATYIYSDDVDRDGHMDIIGSSTYHAGAYQSEIAWFRNNGIDDNWEKNIIWSSDALPTVYNAMGIVVADIDGDDTNDVISVASRNSLGVHGSVYWFKANDTPAGPWQKIDIALDEEDSFYKVYTIDPDEDGDMDLVVGGRLATYLFVNPGNLAANPSQEWKKYTMPEGTGLGIDLADMNNDGRVDVLSCNRDFDRVSWTEINWADGDFTFVEHVVAAELDGVFDPTAIIINKNSRPDIVVSKTFSPGVHWLKAPSTDDGEWTKHFVDKDLYASDVYSGDIDNNGQEDVVLSGFAMGYQRETQDDSISWFQPLSSESGISWERNDIEMEPGIVDPGDISLDDIDGDGDLDVVTTSYTDGEILWYENLLN